MRSWQRPSDRKPALRISCRPESKNGFDSIGRSSSARIRRLQPTWA